MKPYWALIRVNLRLALRERIAIFFNYIFPLIFFFAFGELLHARQGGAIVPVVILVLVIGVLGNGLFGGGIRTVQDREQNILRRFKVAPISPAPLLTASMITGWALYLPAVVMTLALAHFVYGMPVPGRWLSLLVLVSAGVIAFRAIGLIIASVANSAQESQILVQLVYLPMLFLTGTTFSITMLPTWVQALSQFLPATWLVTSLQGTLLENEPLSRNWTALAVLAITTVVSTFLSLQLFRWEKEEKLRASAKLSLAVIILPSLAFGGWQVYTHDYTGRARALYRQIERGRSLLIRNARVVTGDGRVLDSGAVLVRAGKIAAVFERSVPDAATLQAEPLEAAGKTVLPGLIDLDVALGRSAVPSIEPDAGRALAAWLYCGVTAVRSTDENPALPLVFAAQVDRGERLGAEVFVAGSGIARAATPEAAGRALDAGARGIEYTGDARLPAGLLARMAAARVAYLPLLSPANADPASLAADSLVEQVVPPALLRKPAAPYTPAVGFVSHNLLQAWRAGVPLAAASGAGSPWVVPGPSVQRELELWVRAGVPAAAALEAATAEAARLLGASARLGTIAEGREANLLLVDGNPLEDIAALERVSAVIFNGEQIDRSELLKKQ